MSTPRARTSGMAVGSLVAALAGCLIVTAPLAVVLGHLALEHIDASDGAQGGRGIAVAGLMIGWAAVGVYFALALAFFVYALSL